MVNQLKITRKIDSEVLYNFYKKARDYRIRERTLMVIHVFEGKSATETAEIFIKSRQTVSIWVRRFNEGGLKALEDKTRTGRPSEVDYDDLGHALSLKPSDFGYPHEAWFPKLVYNYICQYQGVEIAYDYVYILIKKAGYSLIVPRERSYKSDPNKVEDFRNCIREGIETGEIDENDLTAIDETAVQLFTNIKKVVAKTGTKPIMKIEKNYKGITIIGAITGWGEFVYRLQDHAASKFEFCEFLEYLKEQSTGQNIHAILDRANYHYNKIVFQKADDLEIELHFQPTHSPFLNAAEEVWRQLKHWLRGRLFYTQNNLKQEIQKFFDFNPFLNIKVVRYIL